MKKCLLCPGQNVRKLVDFGALPVCHHFFDGRQQEGTHPAALGQCEDCGAVQMMQPIPPTKLLPRVDWITYNEPEAHLDAMVELLCGLPGINKESNIAGVTYKEDTTLRRFRERGFTRGWRADAAADLGIADKHAGIETVQERICPALAAELRRKHGQPDLIIVRHMLEHAHNPPAFLETFRTWVKPNGFVVFEVPDCQRAFDLSDYTTLWEDHSIYFVEPTFLSALKRSGFSVLRFERFLGAYENCLVAVTQPDAAARPALPSSGELQQERERALGFAAGFGDRRTAVRQLLSQWRKHGKIAMFGAGHQAAMFINLMGVADLIAFVVDDDAHKCGLRMPGSRLPIVASEALVREDVRLCLSSLGTDSEKKVVAKQQLFFQRGGSFASIFPTKADALLNFVAGPSTIA